LITVSEIFQTMNQRKIKCFILSRVRCDYRRGSGLAIGFIDHFTTQIVTTLNYNAIANLHNSQLTRTHAKSFPACIVFTRHFLVTASSNGYSSASALKSPPNGSSLPAVLSIYYKWFTAISYQPPSFLFTA
jgi:hypothetical protein